MRPIFPTSCHPVPPASVKRTERSQAWVILTSLFALFSLVPPVRSDEPEAVGRFISVPPVLTGDSVKRIGQTTEDEVKRFRQAEQERPLDKRRSFKVLFDFTPNGNAARSEDFGACEGLAQHIRALYQDGGGMVETIAYIHGDVSGHTVLPVLACRQIVMSSKAKLGPVFRSEPNKPFSLEKHRREAYLSLGAHWNENALQRLLEPAKPAVFDFPRARDAGLVTDRNAYESRQDLARAYRLGRAALQEDPLLDRVVAWQIPVSGEVNASLREQLDRRLRRALNAQANLIVLELKCRGGDTAIASSIAETLFTLNEKRADTPVVTVAYVTRDASDTAVYLALGCQYIIMEQGAHLGDFGKLIKDRSADEMRAAGEGLEELARHQFYPPSLVRAFVDKGVGNLFLVTSGRGTREQAILTGRQLSADLKEDRGKWQQPEEIALNADGLLTLDAAQAQRFGLVVAKVSDLSELYDRYGLKPSQVKVSGADWLDDLAEFLRNDWTSFLLVMIGITCLILELKLPGVGLPGVVAALCFVLYFWSHSQALGGQVTWLGILLFLLGLVLVGIEVFILPGFGVCGISGIVLMIGSLALVAYGHWPQTGAEWVDLSKKVGPFGLVLMASIVAAIVLARYLPSIPFANRLVLHPPAEDEGALVAAGEAAVSESAALLGAIGIAATPLRPAGKVQFGEKFVDVVAEGSYVAPGTRVQVIEIEGNRVVVKEV